MSDIQSCLSVFAVAAWANTDVSFRQAENAINSYIALHSGEYEAEALQALQTAFSKMQLDSAVANQIRASIEARISALNPPLGETDAPDNHLT